MIYINFLFFIIAISLWGSAPGAAGGLFTPGQNLLGVMMMMLAYWHYARLKFQRLRNALEEREISVMEAEKSFNTRINIHFILAIVFLSFETYVFDLKAFIVGIPYLGLSEFFVNITGLVVFFLHLFIMWYWGYKRFGDVLRLAPTLKSYISANFKFNIAIIIPWAALLFIFDIISFAAPSVENYLHAPISREIFFGLFLVFFAIMGPVLIVRLWDCEPLPPSELKDEILKFCHSQGVRFRGVMSWNALNKGLVTAGVMGLIAPFRYLMITPGLMAMLDREEIMAVVSHEVGHVRKKHLLFYLLFFLGFIILSGGLLDWLMILFFTHPVFFSLFSQPEQGLNVGMLSFFIIMASLLLFILYFRFVFGYFIRNFERQADGYCFASGINPQAMISSFMKLGVRLGDDGKRSNWHHFNLSQRIEFLKRAQEEPGIIRAHDRTVKRRLLLFVAGLIVFSVISFQYSGFGGEGMLNPERVASILESKLAEAPDNALLHAYLGDAYFQMKEWKKAHKAWNASLAIQYHQPQVLNNLAWLLLTAEDKILLDPKRALKLALDAVTLDKSSHILDTLAEAYYQNEMYSEAYRTAEKALETGGDNRAYLQRQLDKMAKALKKAETSPHKDHTI